MGSLAWPLTELHDGEHRQRRGIRTEPFRGVDTDRGEGAAVDDGEHVRRDPDTPDEPAAPSRPGGGGRAVQGHAVYATRARAPLRTASEGEDPGEEVEQARQHDRADDHHGHGAPADSKPLPEDDDESDAQKRHKRSLREWHSRGAIRRGSQRFARSS